MITSEQLEQKLRSLIQEASKHYGYLANYNDDLKDREPILRRLAEIQAQCKLIAEWSQIEPDHIRLAFMILSVSYSGFSTFEEQYFPLLAAWYEGKGPAQFCEMPISWSELQLRAEQYKVSPVIDNASIFQYDRDESLDQGDDWQPDPDFGRSEIPYSRDWA